MRIRIDLKIFIFFVIFYFTNQLKQYIIIMIFSIIHEIGHIVIAILLKNKVKKIEIMPFGVTASFDSNLYTNKRKEVIVALAGPLTSIILAILTTSQETFYSNILIAIFNLIPVFPLDGGRIIKGILHIKFGKEKSEILIDKIANITMIILTIISSIGVYYYKNFAIFMICIFLWWMMIQEKKTKHLIFCEENSKIYVKK